VKIGIRLDVQRGFLITRSGLVAADARRDFVKRLAQRLDTDGTKI